MRFHLVGLSYQEILKRRGKEEWETSLLPNQTSANRLGGRLQWVTIAAAKAEAALQHSKELPCGQLG